MHFKRPTSYFSSITPTFDLSLLRRPRHETSHTVLPENILSFHSIRFWFHREYGNHSHQHVRSSPSRRLQLISTFNARRKGDSATQYNLVVRSPSTPDRGCHQARDSPTRSISTCTAHWGDLTAKFGPVIRPSPTSCQVHG